MIIIIIIIKRILEVCTCTFEKKTHSTRSSWKMPKDNYDSRVHLMLVAHGNSLEYKFFHDQPMSSSFSKIDRPLVLYDLKSGKFHLVIYQSVTIHCHPSMGHTINPKALCFLAVQNNRRF